MIFSMLELFGGSSNKALVMLEFKDTKSARPSCSSCKATTVGGTRKRLKELSSDVNH